MLPTNGRNTDLTSDDAKHVIERKYLLPRLQQHLYELSKEDTTECMFKNVQLEAGWRIVKETLINEETSTVGPVKQKKRKCMTGKIVLLLIV